MMKETIAINAHGSDSWIGGVYYRKNVLFSLLQNDYITKHYNIIVFANNRTADVYRVFSRYCRIYIEKDNKTIIDKILKFLLYKTHRITYSFPSDNYTDHSVVDHEIYWIADFQHHFLPHFFSEQDIDLRIRKERYIEKSNSALVLSSNTALCEFNSLYNKKNTYVVPFVSFIEDEINNISLEIENKVLESISTEKNNYAVIMNQFWQHKNHIVVFEAIKHFLENHPDTSFKFVFTGKMEDYRNPKYINRLKEIALDPLVSSHISILGFIDRKEQIALMKNAAFVIQPSLFEGWGTVVEDAKVLDKTVLLSDIPVHKEQKNDKCILFDPHDSVLLANLIYEESQKKHHDNIQNGIEDMYKRAKDYSKGFETLLKDLNKKE